MGAVAQEKKIRLDPAYILGRACIEAYENLPWRRGEVMSGAYGITKQKGILERPKSKWPEIIRRFPNEMSLFELKVAENRGAYSSMKLERDGSDLYYFGTKGKRGPSEMAFISSNAGSLDACVVLDWHKGSVHVVEKELEEALKEIKPLMDAPHSSPAVHFTFKNQPDYKPLMRLMCRLFGGEGPSEEDL
jgi:hypothetical protein